ncbi:MAG: hypothetical protein R6U15_00050 [Candidatus Izemoplasmatales bacterium]
MIYNKMGDNKKVVNIEYVNAKNIKASIKLKKSLPMTGIIKVTTTRNSPAEFSYEAIKPLEEAKLISRNLSCLKSL